MTLRLWWVFMGWTANGSYGGMVTSLLHRRTTKHYNTYYVSYSEQVYCTLIQCIWQNTLIEHTAIHIYLINHRWYISTNSKLKRIQFSIHFSLANLLNAIVWSCVLCGSWDLKEWM